MTKCIFFIQYIVNIGFFLMNKINVLNADLDNKKIQNIYTSSITM